MRVEVEGAIKKKRARTIVGTEGHVYTSPVLWSIEGAEVTSGFCEPCAKIHSTVEVEGWRIRHEDLNPLVKAAVSGVELYLESQRLM